MSITSYDELRISGILCQKSTAEGVLLTSRTSDASSSRVPSGVDALRPSICLLDSDEFPCIHNTFQHAGHIGLIIALLQLLMGNRPYI